MGQSPTLLHPGYPERVQCTDEMELSRATQPRFDHRYQGLAAALPGQVTGLE